MSQSIRSQKNKVFTNQVRNIEVVKISLRSLTEGHGLGNLGTGLVCVSRFPVFGGYITNGAKGDGKFKDRFLVVIDCDIYWCWRTFLTNNLIASSTQLQLRL